MMWVSGWFCRVHPDWQESIAQSHSMSAAQPMELPSAKSHMRFGRSIRTVACAVLLVSILAACADDDSERRFANDPIPTEDIAAQPTESLNTNPPTSTVPPVSPVAPDQMLAMAGAAPRLFASLDSRILAIPVDGSAPIEVFDAEDRRIEAAAGSPDGKRVAAITLDDGGNVELVIVEASGQVVSNTELEPLLAPADGTPESNSSRTFALAWAPTGDRVLVGHGGGGLVEVSNAGQTRQLLGADAAPSPQAVAWSPSGSAVAYVDAGPNGTATGLYVASTDALPIDPVAVIRPIVGQSRQIADIAWPQGDVGILYSERSPDGDLSVGGDLFAVAPSGGRPQLVGSSRIVAQVGAIDAFVASPDGSVVAFAVVVAGEAGPVSGGVVVKQVAGPTLVTLPVSSEQADTRVAALDWTAAGLAWVSSGPRAGSLAGLVVSRALPDGSTAIVFSESGLGSPVASPVAEPDITAVPFPAASPVATPVAPPVRFATPESE